MVNGCNQYDFCSYNNRIWNTTSFASSLASRESTCFLVCAAKGCPSLRGNAYTADKLDEQLSVQSLRYLLSPAGIRSNTWITTGR
ncbi:MAG: DUF547 domain-containing protein [Pseudomonadota bacterium]